MANKKNREPLIHSYMAHRKAIGALAFLMPFILALGALILFGESLQSSISAYYYTGMRNVFVGILFIVAMFLFCYRGWGSDDDIVASVSGIFALGVALLPTTPVNAPRSITGYLHLTSATLFFGTLIIFSSVLFVRTDQDPIPPVKKARNIIYKLCGLTMFLCIVLIALYFLFLKKQWPGLEKVKPVFFLETFALWAFGISWLVKGQAILKDDIKKNK